MVMNSLDDELKICLISQLTNRRIDDADDFYEFYELLTLEFPNPHSALPARHREPVRSGEAGGRIPKSEITWLYAKISGS